MSCNAHYWKNGKIMIARYHDIRKEGLQRKTGKNCIEGAEQRKIHDFLVKIIEKLSKLIY